MSSKGRLLVVDDNEMNRDTLSRQLERAGYEVETAAGVHVAPPSDENRAERFAFA